MSKTKRKGDVYWYIPNKKKPIAYSTVATKHIIGLLSEELDTIQDVYDAILYDQEAKEILQKYEIVCVRAISFATPLSIVIKFG